MGIGGVALFIGAGRGAIRLITSGVARPALWLGAACVVVYPLAFYTSMADAGVAIGVTLSLAEIYDGVVFPPPGIRLVRRVEAAEGARPASGP